MPDYSKNKKVSHDSPFVLSNYEQFVQNIISDSEKSDEKNIQLKNNYSADQNDKALGDEKGKKYDNLIEQAQYYIEKKQFFKAIPVLKQQLTLTPKYLNVIDMLCLCLIEQKRIDEALSLSKTGLNNAQSQISQEYIPKFYSYLGKLYLEKSDYNNAVKNFKLALVNNFYDTENNIYLTKCLMKLNKPKEAYEACYKAATYLLCSEEEKNYLLQLQETIREEMIKMFPEERHFKLGNQYFSEKQYKFALKEFEEASKIDPQNILFQEKLFLTNIELNNFKEATRIGEKIISTDTDKIKNYYKGSGHFSMLSKVYSDLSEIYKSTWHFIKASHCKSMFEYYQLILRGIYEGTFCLNKSVEYDKAAYLKMPKRHEALEHFIVSLMLVKDYTNAFKYLSTALNMAKAENNAAKIANYYKIEADCYSDLNQPYESAESFEKALQYTKDNQEKIYIYGRIINIYKEIGNLEKCLSFLEKCSELIKSGAEDTIDIESLYVAIKTKS